MSLVHRVLPAETVATEKPVQAVLTGVSAVPLPAALLDTRLTYEDMEAAGSGLGTATLMVLGQGTDMTAVAAGAARFLAVESCGQCTPCKADGLAITGALEALCRGDGGAEDLDALAKALTTVGDNARCNRPASSRPWSAPSSTAGWTRSSAGPDAWTSRSSPGWWPR